MLLTTMTSTAIIWPEPGVTGSYILWFDLQAPLVVVVNRLGRLHLAAGCWAYVGSAQGPGGLRARVQRHLQPAERRHWHIDSVTGVCPPSAVSFVESTQRQECTLVQALLAAGAAAPIAGFGSSDCRQGCPAHLLHWPASLPETIAWAKAFDFWEKSNA